MRAPYVYILLTTLLLHLCVTNGFCVMSENKKITITGMVIDQQKVPIIGAAVYLTCGGQQSGTVTDFDGKFKVSNYTKDARQFELKVSYVGCKTAIQTFRIPDLNDGEGTVKVTLLDDKRKNKKLNSSIIARDFGISNSSFISQIGTIKKQTPQQLCKEGDKYYKGTDGVNQDYAKALQFYLQAAEQGSSWAQSRVGYMYDVGQGTVEDDTKAVSWYTKAAEQGDSYAQTNLGILYENGKGVAKNYTLAAQWYRKAADEHYARAQSYLAELYYYGNGVQQDYKQAFIWALRAGGQGNRRGQFRLGYLYDTGKGIAKNYRLAKEWYLKAAEQGDLPSMINLGILFEEGKGVEKNFMEALAWYNMAADKGASSAQKYAKDLKDRGVKTAAVNTTAATMDLPTLLNASMPKDEIATVHVSKSTTDTRPSTAKVASTTNASATVTLAKSNYDIVNEVYSTGDYEKTRLLLQDAVQRDDDPRLQNLLGLIFLEGKGVTPDYDKALEHLMIAAVNGNPSAEYNLAVMYDDGLGVKKNETKAFEWFMKAAKHGLIKAQNKLGLCYVNGTGTEKNYKKAVEWYLKAAESNSAMSQYNLGWMYEKGLGVVQDYQKAFEWYMKAAEQNYVDGQNAVGWMYGTGTGIEKDEVKAAEWYQKAADQGSCSAQFNIGNCYEFGQGVKQDYVKAYNWYMKSASQGFDTAECSVGDMYWTGSGVVQNMQEAIKWYEKAAGHQNAVAKKKLAWIYFDGAYAPKNTQRAIALIEEAARTGDAQAQCDAGYMLSEDTPERDYKKAYDWTQKSADQRYATAINNLGWFYEKGNGIPVDIAKAVEYYQVAASQNNTSGIYNLGRMYENGYGGLPQDYKKAMELYLKAADNNHYKAMCNIAKMYDQGRGVDKNVAKAVIWYSKAEKGGDKESESRLAELNQRLSAPSAAGSVTAPASQTNNVVPQRSVQTLPVTAKRIALIIGNDDYGSQRLENPVNDALALNIVLKALGFESSAYVNLDKDETEKIVAEFAEKANHYDMALFYYAGHAIQSKGVNYLIPARPDPVLNPADIRRKYVDLPFIVNSMIDAEAKRNIIILDACRDTPDYIGVKTRGGGRGLASLSEPEGFLVAFSTQAGMTAEDGKGMKHSPYMTVLLEQLKVPGLNVDQLFVRVRDNVQELTHNEQKPFYKNNLSESPKEKFYFNRGNQ